MAELRSFEPLPMESKHISATGTARKNSLFHSSPTPLLPDLSRNGLARDSPASLSSFKQSNSQYFSKDSTFSTENNQQFWRHHIENPCNMSMYAKVKDRKLPSLEDSNENEQNTILWSYGRERHCRKPRHIKKRPESLSTAISPIGIHDRAQVNDNHNNLHHRLSNVRRGKEPRLTGIQRLIVGGCWEEEVQFSSSTDEDDTRQEWPRSKHCNSEFKQKAYKYDPETDSEAETEQNLDSETAADCSFHPLQTAENSSTCGFTGQDHNRRDVWQPKLGRSGNENADGQRVESQEIRGPRFHYRQRRLVPDYQEDPKQEMEQDGIQKHNLFDLRYEDVEGSTSTSGEESSSSDGDVYSHQIGDPKRQRRQRPGDFTLEKNDDVASKAVPSPDSRIKRSKSPETSKNTKMKQIKDKSTGGLSTSRTSDDKVQVTEVSQSVPEVPNLTLNVVVNLTSALSELARSKLSQRDDDVQSPPRPRYIERNDNDIEHASKITPSSKVETTQPYYLRKQHQQQNDEVVEKHHPKLKDRNTQTLKSEESCRETATISKVTSPLSQELVKSATRSIERGRRGTQDRNDSEEILSRTSNMSLPKEKKKTISVPPRITVEVFKDIESKMLGKDDVSDSAIEKQDKYEDRQQKSAKLAKANSIKDPIKQKSSQTWSNLRNSDRDSFYGTSCNVNLELVSQDNVPEARKRTENSAHEVSSQHRRHKSKEDIKKNPAKMSFLKDTPKQNTAVRKQITMDDAKIIQSDEDVKDLNVRNSIDGDVAPRQQGDRPVLQKDRKDVAENESLKKAVKVESTYHRHSRKGVTEESGTTITDAVCKETRELLPQNHRHVDLNSPLHIFPQGSRQKNTEKTEINSPEAKNDDRFDNVAQFDEDERPQKSSKTRHGKNISKEECLNHVRQNHRNTQDLDSRHVLRVLYNKIKKGKFDFQKYVKHEQSRIITETQPLELSQAKGEFSYEPDIKVKDILRGEHTQRDSKQHTTPKPDRILTNIHRQETNEGDQNIRFSKKRTSRLPVPVKISTGSPERTKSILGHLTDISEDSSERAVHNIQSDKDQKFFKTKSHSRGQNSDDRDEVDNSQSASFKEPMISKPQEFCQMSQISDINGSQRMESAVLPAEPNLVTSKQAGCSDGTDSGQRFMKSKARQSIAMDLRANRSVSGYIPGNVAMPMADDMIISSSNDDQRNSNEERRPKVHEYKSGPGKCMKNVKHMIKEELEESGAGELTNNNFRRMGHANEEKDRSRCTSGRQHIHEKGNGTKAAQAAQGTNLLTRQNGPQITQTPGRKACATHEQRKKSCRSKLVNRFQEQCEVWQNTLRNFQNVTKPTAKETRRTKSDYADEDLTNENIPNGPRTEIPQKMSVHQNKGSDSGLSLLGFHSLPEFDSDLNVGERTTPYGAGVHDDNAIKQDVPQHEGEHTRANDCDSQQGQTNVDETAQDFSQPTASSDEGQGSRLSSVFNTSSMDRAHGNIGKKSVSSSVEQQKSDARKISDIFHQQTRVCFHRLLGGQMQTEKARTYSNEPVKSAREISSPQIANETNLALENKDKLTAQHESEKHFETKIPDNFQIVKTENRVSPVDVSSDAAQPETLGGDNLSRPIDNFVPKEDFKQDRKVCSGMTESVPTYSLNIQRQVLDAVLQVINRIVPVLQNQNFSGESQDDIINKVCPAQTDARYPSNLQTQKSPGYLKDLRNMQQTNESDNSAPSASAFQGLQVRVRDFEEHHGGSFRHDCVKRAIQRLASKSNDTPEEPTSLLLNDNPKKLYRLNGTIQGTPDGTLPDQAASCDPDSQAYHENLHSSLQAFRVRKWRPLTPDFVPTSGPTRCRPVSGRPHSSLAISDTNLLLHRPYSDPPSSGPPSRVGSATLPLRRPDTPRVDPGNFDTLSPRILAHLVTSPRPLTPTSTYGDVIEERPRRRKVAKAKNVPSEETANLDGEVSSTSGVDSDGEESEAEENVDSDSSDNDSISELEKGNEPSIDYNRKVPDLHLRPERLDNVYTPENKRDLRRFEFDAEKIDIPMYEFECPIPSAFSKLNFRFHARENSNWRVSASTMGPVDSTLSNIFDRLVEMEKRQIETEEWEEKRLRQLRRRPLSRSAKSRDKSRDKRCCSACLQAACVGDCPNKKVPANCCDRCHQPLCTGTCTDSKYDQRMRQGRDEMDTSIPPRPALPQNCKSCQKRHNAKVINANQVVLGRPKSAFATFSRGKCSAKPKDLRPKSAFHISDGLSKELEKLGIEPLQPTPPGMNKIPRPRSRGDLLPGKSYFSNLNRSLTELSTKRRRSAKAKKRTT